MSEISAGIYLLICKLLSQEKPEASASYLFLITFLPKAPCWRKDGKIVPKFPLSLQQNSNLHYLQSYFSEGNLFWDTNNRWDASGPVLRDIFLFVASFGKYFCYYLMPPSACLPFGGNVPIENWVSNLCIIDRASSARKISYRLYPRKWVVIVLIKIVIY